MSTVSSAIPVGFRETEIGVFPEDWDIKTLDEIGEVTGAGVDKKSNLDEQPVRLVNYVDVYNRRPITSDLLYHWVTAPSIKAKRCRVNRGDVFFTPTSEVREDIAVSSMALEDISDAVYSYHLVRLRCNEEVEITYRVHAFTAKYFLDQASILADGSGTRYVVTLPNFRHMLVALPPREEQRRIGKFLTDVETQITNLEEIINKKKDIKKGTMQELLTGKTRLPGFSDEWQSKLLGDSATLKARIGWQGLTTAEYMENGEYLLVGGTEFNQGFIDWSSCHHVEKIRYDQDRNIQLRTDDVLVTKDGTIGKVALVKDAPKPATLNSGVFVIRPKQTSFDPVFFYYLLLSRVFEEFLDRLVAGSTINHLYQKDFVDFEFDLPPTREEQEALAEVLSDMDAEIAALEERLEKAKAIKQGMIQQLLTGRIRLID